MYSQILHSTIKKTQISSAKDYNDYVGTASCLNYNICLFCGQTNRKKTNNGCTNTYAQMYNIYRQVQKKVASRVAIANLDWRIN